MRKYYLIFITIILLPTQITAQNYLSLEIERVRFLVTLRVYDILGDEIAILVNEEKPNGEYEVEFDGSALTSRIYFYQIKAGSFIQTKKMVYLKQEDL